MVVPIETDDPIDDDLPMGIYNGQGSTLHNCMVCKKIYGCFYLQFIWFNEHEPHTRLCNGCLKRLYIMLKWQFDSEDK